MKNKITLSTIDIIQNRKQIALKLDTYKKVIACASSCDLTITKFINKIVDQYIASNNLDIESLYNQHCEIKAQLFNRDLNTLELMKIKFDDTKKIEL